MHILFNVRTQSRNVDGLSDCSRHLVTRTKNIKNKYSENAYALKGNSRRLLFPFIQSLQSVLWSTPETDHEVFSH